MTGAARPTRRLRLQTEDARAIQRTNPYRTPSLFAQRSPSDVDGPHRGADVPRRVSSRTSRPAATSCAASASWRGNDKVWLSLQNGVHADSLGPDTITRWVEFLKLYVADEIPEVPAPVLSLSGALYAYLAEAGASPVRQSRFAGTTDVAAARRAFERDPRVRLLMDNGAGPQGPGSIGSTWELGFDAWPVRQVRATPYYLGARGTLRRASPPGAGTAAYVADPDARPAQTLPGDGETDAWKAQPPYDWRPLAAGKGVGFTSASAVARRDRRRRVEPRRAPALLRARHRPAGHAERGASRRARDLRAERLAAGLAPQARPPRVDRAGPVADAPAPGRGAAAARGATRSCACRSSPRRTPSGRARGSG